MPFLGWSLLGVSALLFLSGVTGANPWAYVVATIRGEDPPAGKPLKLLPTGEEPLGPKNPPPPNGEQSPRGILNKVVEYARAQIGKPYRFGASGPAAFDCSGLTMRAYGTIGVSLPHSASLQAAKTVRTTSPSVGDLVFWGVPASHCGIYVGGGQVIHAPEPGQNVKQSAIWGNPYYGVVQWKEFSA